MKIFKYPVPLTEMFRLSLPPEAVVLSVQVQHNTPVVWVALDPDAPTVERFFWVIATGQDFTMEKVRFIGTFQLSVIGTRTSVLVLHLFEELAP